MKRCCRCGVKKEDDYTICHQCELEIKNAIKSKRECVENSGYIEDLRNILEDNNDNNTDI